MSRPAVNRAGLFLCTPPLQPEADFTVDLSKCTKTRPLLQCLGQKLAFPDSYGANFDALFDCLTDPGWQADRSPCIKLVGLAEYAHQHVDDFATLLTVLQEACLARMEQGLTLTILIDQPAPDLTGRPSL